MKRCWSMFSVRAKPLGKGLLLESRTKRKKISYIAVLPFLVVGVLTCKTVPPASPESPGEKAEASSPQEVSVSTETATEAIAPGPESAQETQKMTPPDLSEAPLFLGEPPILVGEVPSLPALTEPSSSLKKQEEPQPADKTASTQAGEGQKGSAAPQVSSGTSARQERPAETKPPASSTSSTEQKKTTPPPVLKPTETVVAEQKTESPASPLQSLSEPAVRGEGALPEALSYSRSVRALVGQLVEVPFQGGGWIYLGEVAGRRGLVYDSRRTDPEGQTFIFRAENVGLYSLKFFRQDFLQDYVINDYVRVEVVQNPEITETGGFRLAPDRGRVVAEPRWPPRSTATTPAAAPESSKVSGDQSASPISSSTRVEQGKDTASSPVAAPNTGTAGAVATGNVAPLANVSPGAAAGTPSPSQGAVPAATGGSGPAPGGAPSGTTATGAGAQNLGTSGAPATSTAPGLSAVSGGAPSGLSGLSGVPPASSTLPENSSLETLLRQARDAYEKNQYAAALDLLNQMYASYPAGTDEALWLMGQIFETQGPQRDIKKAYDAYKRLLEEFPTSSRYDEAQRRMRYIERFYFNIR
ncbi:MAG TPA: hypothetical protein PLK03_06600 [Termitinemataceae bacterium]|nr:hypothetical protein [Termitinemataceae bacterium]